MSGLEQAGDLHALALLAVLAAIILVGVAGAGAAAFMSRRSAPHAPNSAWQLKVVRRASFQRRRLLNRSEFPRFKVIEEEVAAAHRGHRIFAQVNLGEILDSKSEKAFRSINSKRVDMLIVDRGGWPLLAIEYQGEGHFQGDASDRDAVKREALCKAGIGYLEVFPNDDSEKIRAAVRKHLGLSADPVRAQRLPHDSSTAPAQSFGRARVT